MPTSLSIKNAPDEIVERLHARARRNHRSLQGELLSIVTEAVAAETDVPDYQAIYERARRRGLSSDPGQIVAWVREDRDSR